MQILTERIVVRKVDWPVNLAGASRSRVRNTSCQRVIRNQDHPGLCPPPYGCLARSLKEQFSRGSV